MSNILEIGIFDAHDAAKVETDLIEQLKAAMRATSNHWLIMNENEQFKAAVLGVMFCYGEGDDEYQRLKKELNLLATISQRHPIDLSSLGDFEPVGIAGIWREVKNAIRS